LGRRGPSQAVARKSGQENGGERFGDEMTNLGGFPPFADKFWLKS
jgi:hypothetical protein